MKKLAILLLVSASAYGQTFITSGSRDPQSATFANLGTPTNGKWRYCSDCAATAPCAGSGTGAFAYRVGSAWNCNAGTPASAIAQVNLQSSTPGTAQTGHLNISGTATAAAFTGNLTGNVTGNVSGSAGTATLANGSAGDFVVGGTLFFATTSDNSIAFTAGTTTGPVFTRAIGGDPLVWTIDMTLITSGSPRTAVVPDASGTMVLDTATQTLTNKTLTDAKTGGVTPAVSNTTANSCGTTTATITGNNTTGVVTVGATAGTNCTITFTVAAPTRRQCTANNETTGNLTRATYLTTTTSTVEGTFVAGDKISYICAVY